MRIQNVLSHRGFTLIELTVVMGVLGVLMGALIIVVNPTEQMRKAHDTQRKNDLSQIQRALEIYYNDHGKYPDMSAYMIVNTDGTPVGWGSSWSPYISRLPKDPGVNRYVYVVGSNNQTYYIYASLERGGKDTAACNNGDPCLKLSSLSVSESACGGTCNYGVSSTNTSP